MKPLVILALALCALAAPAQASIVTMHNAYATHGPQASAEAYRNGVEAALAAPPQPGYVRTAIPVFDNVSNHAYGGVTTNLAYRFTVTFDVAPEQAGPWSFRAGIDFGLGGALFMDGVPLDYSSDDMYWGGAYVAEEDFLSAALPLAAGRHTMQLYGLEYCCDGAQNAQFRIGSGNYTTFGYGDGLAPVPEPASAGMLLAGLGLLVAAGRRGISVPGPAARPGCRC